MEIAGLQSTVNSAVFGMKEKMLKTALLGGCTIGGFDILHIHYEKIENTLLFTYIHIVQPITIVICVCFSLVHNFRFTFFFRISDKAGSRGGV